ncbi:MAG: hypothetical protein GJ679_10890 [Rhodobacteraceae bacterium]|uniref:hypothetical protein n=1 Tax=Roseovarius sp. 10 TaxID=3080563 RepID=UPI001938A973|nr:hypothetical protein [Roseovarius sp. 10]MBE1290490.1 hypothetical protein [Paracoccaceae bacterium]MDV7201260.1 hypothetical protein [Roseovarius sp. 10]QPI86324.1 hypothetical protein I3V23_04980 [Rhodobacterales bacterium HKCCA1288]
MSENSGGLTCAAVSWGLAALVGAFAGVLVAVLGDWSFMQAVFAAVIVAVGVGLFLMLTLCRSLPEPANKSVSAPQPATPKPAAPKAAAPAASATTKPAAKPKAAPKPKAAAKSKAAAKPKAPAKAAAPAATTGAGTRPAALSAARASGADDLKMIKGVGPKLEALLNRLGFYHFDQVASWTADEVAWVDQNLEGFKGRVSRDNWVAQAKTLATGGQTEFSKRVGDGDVY